MKNLKFLSFVIVLLTIISTTFGIFYTTGGSSYTVPNIYGEMVELYGDGIYKNDSLFKAGVNKGTDVIMFIVAVLFTVTTILSNKNSKYKLLNIGLLAGLFYYSACMAFGVTFNKLFPIYVLLFSSTLFTLMFLLIELFRETKLSEEVSKTKFHGTAVFLMISGSSVLMWLQFIIPALINDTTLSNIEIYTTEPTFVLDLAIILPTYFGCGIALIKRKTIGYKLAPVLLTFITIIGIMVIGQTIVQRSMGIDIPIQQFIGLVLSFVVLGIIASILNVKLLKYIK